MRRRTRFWLVLLLAVPVAVLCAAGNYEDYDAYLESLYRDTVPAIAPEEAGARSASEPATVVLDVRSDPERGVSFIEGSEFFMDCDASVVAIGNSPNPLIPRSTPEIKIGRKGNIEADEETGKTSMEKVWAGGDVVTGAATVILAMGAGRIAARSMHEYLSQ